MNDLLLWLSLPVAGLVSGRRRRLSLLQQFVEALAAMRVGQDLGQTLAETLARVREILEARTALLFFYDAEAEQLYRWTSETAEAQASLSELPAVENVLWIDFASPEGLERLAGTHPLVQRLNARQAVAVGCTARGNCARLFLVDLEDDPGSKADSLLGRLGNLLFGLAEHMFLLRHVRSRAIDEERARIAQDFHDGPLQTFFSFDMHLQFIRQILREDPQRAAEALESLQELARQQGRELRDLLQEMRPVDIEGATLMSVLRQVVETSRKSGDLSVRLLGGAHGLAVPRRICREIYQVLQEALNNARKHARAQHAVVSLEEGPGFFTLTIDDDGQGFNFSGRHTLEEMDRLRIGPVSIKQRARKMGADLAVESMPGHGARIILRVPLPRPSPAPPRPASTAPQPAPDTSAPGPEPPRPATPRNPKT